MTNLPKESIYIIWAVGLGLISFIVIDRERYRKLFPYGLIAGFLFATLFIGFMIATNGFHYKNFGALHYRGVPVFIAVAWIPAIMLFLHFLPRLGSWEYFLYLLSWVLMSMMIQHGFELLYLLDTGWFNEPLRLVFSLIWFYIVSYWYSNSYFDV